MRSEDPKMRRDDGPQCIENSQYHFKTVHFHPSEEERLDYIRLESFYSNLKN